VPVGDEATNRAREAFFDQGIHQVLLKRCWLTGAGVQLSEVRLVRRGAGSAFRGWHRSAM
jgi:hypothetical protein